MCNFKFKFKLNLIKFDKFNYALIYNFLFRYKKISVSLNLYKKGVLKETMFAIGNFHRSMLAIEKFIVQDIRNSFKESWQTQILVCLFKWMTNLLELLYPNSDDSDIDMSISTDVPLINITDSDDSIIEDDTYNKNNESKHLVIYRRKNR